MAVEGGFGRIVFEAAKSSLRVLSPISTSLDLAPLPGIVEHAPVEGDGVMIVAQEALRETFGVA